MKLKYGRKFEHGQILPIVAIGIFALAGMAVLLLDVGALFVNRRAAQNAADAGALAGARVLCQTGNPSEAAIQAAVSKYVTESMSNTSGRPLSISSCLVRICLFSQTTGSS